MEHRMGFEPTIFLPHWKCGAITRFRSPMPLKSQYRWDFTHTVLNPIETVLLLRTTCNMNSDVTNPIHTHAFMHWHSLLYYYTKAHTHHMIGRLKPTQPRLFGNIHCLLSPRMHSFTSHTTSPLALRKVWCLTWFEMAVVVGLEPTVAFATDSMLHCFHIVVWTISSPKYLGHPL